MTDNSGESFSSTSGLLSGAAPDEAPTQAPALSRLNPSRPRGFRALVRQAAGAADAVPRSQSLSQQVDSPRIGALASSNASMSQASGSPLLGRLGEVSTSSFTEPDDIVPQEQTAAKLPNGNEPLVCADNSFCTDWLPRSWEVSALLPYALLHASVNPTLGLQAIAPQGCVSSTPHLLSPLVCMLQQHRLHSLIQRLLRFALRRQFAQPLFVHSNA